MTNNNQEKIKEKERVICFSCFNIETMKGIVTYCPDCKEIPMRTLNQIDNSLIENIKKETSKQFENKIKELELRDIDKEIHDNPKKFAWLGKSERRHIDFDNGFQFAINEIKQKDIKDDE